VDNMVSVQEGDMSVLLTAHLLAPMSSASSGSRGVNRYSRCLPYAHVSRSGSRSPDLLPGRADLARSLEAPPCGGKQGA
jgi:hypothetical protein